MAPVMKALSSDVRLKILDLLDQQDMNIQKLGAKLGLSKTAILNHVNVLEKAGFINTRYVPGTVGNQKLCSKTYDRLIFNFSPSQHNEDRRQYYEVEIGVGNYFDFSVYPPCGLADEGHIIQKWDDPSVFFDAQRVTAQLAWASFGYLEYRIPINIPFEGLGLDKIEVLMEISAQGDMLLPDGEGGHTQHAALMLPEDVALSQIDPKRSDVTIWLGNVEVGTVAVSDDFRYQRVGRYTPTWWRGSACGQLIDMVVDGTGTYVNGRRTADTKLEDILDTRELQRNRLLKERMASSDYLPLRIGTKADSRHIGGFTLFGKGFGNYPHGILVRFY